MLLGAGRQNKHGIRDVLRWRMIGDIKGGGGGTGLNEGGKGWW